MYELLNKLEKLIHDWETVPYKGDIEKGVMQRCANELRHIIGYGADLEGYCCNCSKQLYIRRFCDACDDK